MIIKQINQNVRTIPHTNPNKNSSLSNHKESTKIQKQNFQKMEIRGMGAKKKNTD